MASKKRKKNENWITFSDIPLCREIFRWTSQKASFRIFGKLFVNGKRSQKEQDENCPQGLECKRYDPSHWILEGFVWSHQSKLVLISPHKIGQVIIFHLVFSEYRNQSPNFTHLNFCDVALLFAIVQCDGNYECYDWSNNTRMTSRETCCLCFAQRGARFLKNVCEIISN